MAIADLLQDSGSINQFLHYGYVIPGEFDLWGAIGEEVPVEPWRGEEAGELVKTGVRKLRASVEQALHSAQAAGVHVVPLSGGLDSRAVLGGVLERLDARQVHTVTFGLPGAWDYEIGRRVAREAGVANTALDLSEITWETDMLVRFAAESSSPVQVFKAYIFHQMRLPFGDRCIYWSGYLGDVLGGSNLPEKRSDTWREAQEAFSARCRASKDMNAAGPDFDAEKSLPAGPFVNHNGVCFDDQLDIAVRQQFCVKPIVLRPGYRYCTPFICPDWCRFILGVPYGLRKNQYLYKEILKAALPRLFSLPVKGHRGLCLDAPRWRMSLRKKTLRVKKGLKRLAPVFDWGVQPDIHFIDFDRDLRLGRSLTEVVRENLQDLKRRGIVDWLDIDELYRQHQGGARNCGDALTLLASLEINLKAACLWVQGAEPASGGH